MGRGLAHTAHAATTAPEARPPASISALEERPCGLGAGWRSGAWPKSRNCPLLRSACASTIQAGGLTSLVGLCPASCRDLLAKGGFRHKAVCIIFVYKFETATTGPTRERGPYVLLFARMRGVSSVLHY